MRTSLKTSIAGCVVDSSHRDATLPVHAINLTNVSERSGDRRPDRPGQSENKTLEALEAEHGDLQKEWNDLQVQIIAAYDSLRAALSRSVPDSVATDVEALETTLRRLHTRQAEIIERQQDIEGKMIDSKR